MNTLVMGIINATFVAAFTLVTLSLIGCGDSEIGKGITDTVKKTVAGQVAGEAEKIKKQFDQKIIDMGLGKNPNENGKDAVGAGEGKSDSDSDEESETESD